MHLYQQSLVDREKFDGVLVYLARDARERQRQSVARRQMVAGEFPRAHGQSMPFPDLKAVWVIHLEYTL